MIATLHIQAALRNGITWLKRSYFTTPFKVANITDNKKDRTLCLMLMSSSPGILDGDDYQVNIELEQGCSLMLQTQSYQRLFNMKQSARQQMQVRLAAGADFYFLPHPSVPHELSNFTAVNRFYLSEGCRLTFGEILTCGRKLNGEVFAFSKYHNLTEIFINDRLVIRENLLVEPAVIDVNAIGQYEGFTHQASLLYLDEAADIKALVSTISLFLSAHKTITAGVTAAPANGLIVRLLGQKAELLHACLKNIAALVPQTITPKPIAHAV